MQSETNKSVLPKWEEKWVTAKKGRSSGQAYDERIYFNWARKVSENDGRVLTPPSLRQQGLPGFSPWPVAFLRMHMLSWGTSSIKNHPHLPADDSQTLHDKPSSLILSHRITSPLSSWLHTEMCGKLKLSMTQTEPVTSQHPHQPCSSWVPEYWKQH